MGAFKYSNALLSSAFRAISYIFLRVVPHHLAVPVIPTLYILYLLTYAPAANQAQLEGAAEVEIVEESQEKSNGEPTAKTSEKIVAKSSPSPLTTLLLSLPTSAARLRASNLAINTLLLLAFADFIATPYFDTAKDVTFTRVGAVHPDAARITVRYPHPYQTEHNETVTEGAVQVQWRLVKASDIETKWQDGPLVHLSAEHDWTNTVSLGDLSPSTTYEYRLNCESPCLPYPAKPIKFHTFPDPRLASGSHFRFVFTSCTTPNFPYLPFHGRTIKGYDLLAEYLWPSKPLVDVKVNLTEAVETAKEVVSEVVESAKEIVSEVSETISAAIANETLSSSSSSSVYWSPSPSPSPSAAPAPVTAETETAPVEFMLFLGDFIYADVPVYFGDSEEAYRQLYRRTYNSPSFRKVYEKLPIFHAYDDHEILNNYAGQGNDSLSPFANAASAYDIYLGAANYDSHSASPASTFGEKKNYYDFRYGDAAFFVMDTRRYRSDITTESVETRTMLGEEQVGALYDWLSRVNSTATFKFIVTSVPFTSLWTYEGQIDTWAAFATEKAELLSVLHTVPNVIFLSGDRHEFAVIEFTPEQPFGHTVLEVSTSPLNMFYVPLVRTLKARSEETVQKLKTELVTNEDGLSETVTTFEEVPRERVVKYEPVGNHKWSSLEVDTRDADKPIVRLELVVDGKSSYRMEIPGTPVKLRSTTALGALMPQNFRGVLDRIGLKPSKWF